MFYSQFPIWINLLLMGSYLVNKGAAIRCYICGGEEEDSLPCSGFQVWDSRHNKDCGGNSHSCLLSRKVNDKNILGRSCVNIKLDDDCKIANDVEYCYCSKNLCNKMTPMDAKEEQEEIEEDLSEESIEGSGTKNVEQKVASLEPGIVEKSSSTTEKAAVDPNKAVESNVVPNDQKYSSSCIVVRSNLYLSVNVLNLLYFMYTKQY